MLCEFADALPAFVESFLDRGRMLRRRFREETITDIVMGSMITAGVGRVVVDFPNEPVTGADMQWDFVNPDDNTFFRILLQAKQAYGDGSSWTRHCYRELFHASGTPLKLQSQALCDTARNATVPTYPLYIFYNSLRTCALARKHGNFHVIGVTLADAYEIEGLVRAATTRALRTRNRSLGQIAPHFFHLTKLFCPPSVLPAGPFAFVPRAFLLYLANVAGQMVVGAPIPPTPQEIQNRLVEVRPSGFADSPIVDGRHSSKDAQAVPEVGHTIPDDVRAVLSRRGMSAPEAGATNRWRVTFISSSPRDETGVTSR